MFSVFSFFLEIRPLFFWFSPFTTLLGNGWGNGENGPRFLQPAFFKESGREKTVLDFSKPPPLSASVENIYSGYYLYGFLDVWVGGATGCPGMKIVYFTLPKYKRRKLFESGRRK